MAFLNGSAPGTADDEMGPFQDVEEEWGFGTGFVWAKKIRSVYTYRVMYAIDDTGGETPSATWSVGGDTYNLISAGPDRGYLDKIGTYTAVYKFEDDWAWA